MRQLECHARPWRRWSSLPSKEPLQQRRLVSNRTLPISRARSLPPGPSSSRVWSSLDSKSDVPSETETERTHDVGGSSFYTGSDSVTEMALISESSKRSTGAAQEPTKLPQFPLSSLPKDERPQNIVARIPLIYSCKQSQRDQCRWSKKEKEDQDG